MMIAENHGKFRIRLKDRHERGQEVGFPRVIVMQAGNKAPPGFGKSCEVVQCDAEVAFILAVTKARVFQRSHIGLDFLRSTVIGDDELKIDVGLGAGAGHGLTEISQAAVGGDDDRDRGRGGEHG